jgi:hypothetical protein
MERQPVPIPPHHRLLMLGLLEPTRRQPLPTQVQLEATRRLLPPLPMLEPQLHHPEPYRLVTLQLLRQRLTLELLEVTLQLPRPRLTLELLEVMQMHLLRGRFLLDILQLLQQHLILNRYPLLLQPTLPAQHLPHTQRLPPPASPPQRQLMQELLEPTRRQHLPTQVQLEATRRLLPPLPMLEPQLHHPEQYLQESPQHLLLPLTPRHPNKNSMPPVSSYLNQDTPPRLQRTVVPP